MASETLTERTTRPEQLMGEYPNKECNMTTWVDKIKNEIEVQCGQMEQHDDFVEKIVKNLNWMCNPN